MKTYNYGIYNFGRNEKKKKCRNEVRKILSSVSDEDKRKLKELEEIWKNE